MWRGPSHGMTVPERENAVTTAETPDFYWMGFEAYGQGQTIDHAPGAEDSTDRLDWIDGWEFAKFASAASPDLDDRDEIEPPRRAAETFVLSNEPTRTSAGRMKADRG